MADRAGLLNRCRELNPYREFESHPLRVPYPFGIFQKVFLGSTPKRVDVNERRRIKPRPSICNFQSFYNRKPFVVSVSFSYGSLRLLSCFCITPNIAKTYLRYTSLYNMFDNLSEKMRRFCR